MNLRRLIAVLVLAAVGAFFFFLSGFAYAGGFPSGGFELTFIADVSVLCLLGASVIALMSFKNPDKVSHRSKMTYATLFLGLFLVLVAFLIPFPVGCNLDAWPYNLTNVSHGCPASPEGAWSTIWPNALTTCFGVILVTSVYGRLRSRNAAIPGLGMGLIVSGFLLLVWGLSIGYSTSCPGNGCPPLTGSQWWSLFWPDVTAEIMGVLCMVAGTVILFASRGSRPEVKSVWG